jgi:DNA-directed RNA polymerase subunit RPC12/RpoP
MRAYRCDACGRLFLLPDNSLNFEGPDDDELPDSHIPMSLYYDYNHGIATTHYDICRECANRILREVNKISSEYKTRREFELFPETEVHE